MRLIVNVPIEIIEMKNWTTASYKRIEVSVFIIKRRPITRQYLKIQRYTYEAHYFRDDSQIEFYDTSMYCKKCAVDVIDRKINKNFNPKKLIFIDNIYEIRDMDFKDVM